ncbi:MAG: pyruvate kinase [Acidimicrobiia bacterium]|nr:pyruvate kinase [Acidimicrobiia bacterium]
MARKTKIIATLGPAVASREMIGLLVAAGMDVARLNFSHGTHESHALWLGWVRAAAAEHGRAVAVLQDIQGPRIRVGTFPEGRVELHNGSRLTLLDGEGEGTARRVFVQHLAAADLGRGDRVLLADGLIELRVTRRLAGGVGAVVVQGGVLSDHKGAAFPGAHLALPGVTEKDRVDLAFGREIGVDLIAASFVVSAKDIAAVRAVAGDTPVIAKIERAAALDNLAAILAAADGAMVARGDLGVEIGYEPLPRIQKEILAATNAAGGISITATEMLESMTASPRPTRAEVTDVANAVMDGTDAVMLSAETSIGRYPVRAVEAMGAICEEAEKSPARAAPPDFVGSPGSSASAIARATAEAADGLGLGLVVAFTETGATARLLSKYRPAAAILGLTPRPETLRRMAILWGVTPVALTRRASTDAMIDAADRILLQRGLAARGDRVAMAAGVPPNQDLATNLLKLHVVGEETRGMGRR